MPPARQKTTTLANQNNNTRRALPFAQHARPPRAHLCDASALGSASFRWLPGSGPACVTLSAPPLSSAADPRRPHLPCRAGHRPPVRGLPRHQRHGPVRPARRCGSSAGFPSELVLSGCGGRRRWPGGEKTAARSAALPPPGGIFAVSRRHCGASRPPSDQSPRSPLLDSHSSCDVTPSPAGIDPHTHLDMPFMGQARAQQQSPQRSLHVFLQRPASASAALKCATLVFPALTVAPRWHSLNTPFPSGQVTADDFFTGQSAALAGGTTMCAIITARAA